MKKPSERIGEILSELKKTNKELLMHVDNADWFLRILAIEHYLDEQVTGEEKKPNLTTRRTGPFTTV